jgi:hypothetical protein
MGNKFLKQINNLIIIESIKVLQILEIDQTFLGGRALRAFRQGLLHSLGSTPPKLLEVASTLW